MMPDWILPVAAAFIAGWCRGRFKQVSRRFDLLAEAINDARRWRSAYELQRDHAPEFPRFSSGRRVAESEQPNQPDSQEI